MSFGARGWDKCCAISERFDFWRWAKSKVDSLLGRLNNERRTCGPAGVKYTRSALRSVVAEILDDKFGDEGIH